jgi:hypothetical protein
VLETPVGKFKDVLKTEETTPLEPGEKEYKFYAPVSSHKLVRKVHLVLIAVIFTLVIASPSISNHGYFDVTKVQTIELSSE